MSARPSTADPHATQHRDINAKIAKLYEGRQARLQLPLRLSSQYGDWILDTDTSGRLIAISVTTSQVTILANP